ncbi:hypothetical protein RSPO_m00503 (plasmid) [Ralstonia solanacearum Po82]|uniref:Uncharacterized protein n=1 Tax=Ralstonia solanacearum (strain Po82) TaxID=1031711 RepID=F6G9Q7_RALS8|nr:hypothetical protein RSPO_m00503 [Ralstonia solanacearum Po82]
MGGTIPCRCAGRPMRGIHLRTRLRGAGGLPLRSVMRLAGYGHASGSQTLQATALAHRPEPGPAPWMHTGMTS